MPETTPGGKALRFYSSVRIKAHTIKPSKTTSNAYVVAYKIVKNKLAPCPEDKIEFDFIRGKGPDPVIDTLNAAKDLGVLCFAGSQLKGKLLGDTEYRKITSGGVNGWIDLCKSEPDILDKVRETCLAIAAGTVLAEEAPDEEPEPDLESEDSEPSEKE